MVRVRILVPLPFYANVADDEAIQFHRKRADSMINKLWATIVEFLSDVKGELKKVSYPTKAETIGSTSVVLVFCVIMSLYLSFVDSVLVWLVRQVI